MIYKAYFDGSCVLNDCGIGYVIRDPNGCTVYKASEYAGRGDALKAEYLALMALLHRLAALHIGQAVIYGDSRTVVCQVKGLINTRETNRFRDAIMRMRKYFEEHPGWRLKWIPRAANGHADALAAEGLMEVKSTESSRTAEPGESWCREGRR
jgi:ribonuclease HI